MQERSETLNKQILLSSSEKHFGCLTITPIISPLFKHSNSFKIKLEDYTGDPVISFSSAKKPSPKRNPEQHIAVSRTNTSPIIKKSIDPPRYSMSKFIPQKANFIDEEDSELQLESNESIFASCKSKISKYFCG